MWTLEEGLVAMGQISPIFRNFQMPPILLFFWVLLSERERERRKEAKTERKLWKNSRKKNLGIQIRYEFYIQI